MGINSRKLKDYLKLEYSRLAIARDGFWFVDIPRTSSSSIRSELGLGFSMVHGKKKGPRKRFFRKLILDHRTAQEMSDMLGKELWEKIYTFTVVRNPWDRTYSMYNTRKKAGHFPKEWALGDYVRELATKGSESTYFKYRVFRYGAADYLLGESGQIMVDYVAKFENREEDLQVIASRLKMANLGERHINSAAPANRHYSQAYDGESMETVRNLYAKDIELFGYEFDDQR